MKRHLSSKTESKKQRREVRKLTLVFLLIGLLVFELGNFIGYTAIVAADQKNTGIYNLDETDLAAELAFSAEAQADVSQNDTTLQAAETVKNLPVPIIRYYSIAGKTSYYTRHHAMYTPVQDLEKQIHYLHDAAITSMLLSDIYNAFYNDTAMPQKATVITFAGGYSSQYTRAFPILKKYRKKAVFFIPTAQIDKPGHLTKQQIKEMSDAGMEIQSQGVTMGRMTSQLGEAVVTQELTESRQKIEQITAKPVQYFAYQNGVYDPGVATAAKTQGYLLGVRVYSKKVQTSSWPYVLNSYAISGQISMTTFYNIVRPPAEKSIRLPILGYHQIADNNAAYVSVAGFEKQMKYLHDNGYKTVKLKDLYDALYKGVKLPHKSVIITFDDGPQSQYINAFPILKKYGFVAIFFVTTDHIAADSSGYYMSKDQIKELSDSGMEIGSHSKSHPLSLTTLPLTQVAQELSLSKKTLEDLTGKPIYFFCYPRGKYNATLYKYLHWYGYRLATRVGGGVIQSSSAPFRLNRFMIGYSTTLSKFIEGVSN